MRRTHAALVSLAGLIVLGACAGRDSTAPRELATDGPNASRNVPPSTACNFTTMKSAADSYFASKTDSAYTYMNAMKKVFDGGKTDTATKIGWSIGRLVAKERLTSATQTGAGAAGGAFLVGVMQCMSDVSSGTAPYSALQIPTGFSSNAASILTSGIWEVRGGTVNSQLPAAGRVIDNSTQAREFGLPRWGVEPATTDNTWPGATQYAVYGYPTNIGNLVIGSAGDINTNEVEANSFELGTIPSGTPKTDLRVGVCIHQDVINGVANRMVHSNSEILDINHMTQLCDFSNSSFTASVRLQPSWYASALSTIGRVLSPAPAFAQFTDCTDCIGGLPSDWSPFTPGGITVSNVVLSIVTQPNDAIEVVAPNTTPNVFVTIKATVNGVPVPGVSVDTIQVFNNSGSPAGAVVTAFDPGLPTGSNGQTTASFGIGKPGGYIIVISAKLDGSSTQVVTSAMFHIKNS